jgi:hypothetical protein
MPCLKEFVVKAIARINPAKQASFYAKARSNPYFWSAFGYVFKISFFLWLASNPDNKISYSTWPRSAVSTRATRSTRSAVHKQGQQAELHCLQPVGLDKVIIHGGDVDTSRVNHG